MNPTPATAAGTAACPVMHAAVAKADVLVIAAPKRMVLQYMTAEAGGTELVLFYGDKEITFDAPHLFAFGETLARQSRFAAGEALAWGEGLSWAEVQDCLGALIAAGVLMREGEAEAHPLAPANRSRPSPLAPAQAQAPASWAELPAITARLAGRSVEAGWLELVIPVFRIAHIALDADDRQVGEANVFPRALRLERPTEWMACTYAGSRYLDPRPMNLTALKSMRAHWDTMMLALAAIRAAYLARFPGLAAPLSIGAIERLATLVLAVPTYQIVKGKDPVPNGALHPALSSLFRVTDGLRVVMHQMLFVPVGEPALPPETPMSAGRILDYAERTFAFHSETGVCAGPRHFVRAFLEVLVEGRQPEAPPDFAFPPAVAAALADIEEAFDYGLEALRAHAAVFTAWPKMARCYERLAATIAAAAARGPGLAELNERLQDHLLTLKHSTYLGIEAWRSGREAAYGEMFAGCSAGLGDGDAALLAALPGQHGLGAEIAGLLCATRPALAAQPEAAADIASSLAALAHDLQALLATAAGCQARINLTLGRPHPVRAFSAADINVHVLLQGPQPGKRLPFLLEEVKTLFGIDLAIEAGAIRLSAVEEPSVG